MKKNKVLLLGWDAADWKIIGPLLAKGYMPSLKKLINKGVYGNMMTLNPPYSPMLWTSVATGKMPDKHGVHGFIEPSPDGRSIRPIMVTARKTRAIWNILHNQGYRTNLVGWWPSHPAEPLNGVVVSDKFQKVGKNPEKVSVLDKQAIHPKAMYKKLEALRMFPFEVTQEHILPFIPQAAKINQDKSNSLKAFAKMLSETTSVHNASTLLVRETEWDFMGVYFDFIDHFCHAFMQFHPPKHRGVSEEHFQIYKDVINGAYRFQDMILGRMLELVDDDTTVIVMSDHGFESGSKRIINMPKVNAAPALEHRKFGIFVAAGPNIKKNEKIFGCNLIDVAPTILHHFRLPVGKDMEGKVLLDIFENQDKVKYIDSWDKVEGDFGENKDQINHESLSDKDAMDQLVELGYVERPDDKLENAIKKVQCDLKHNLARVQLGQNNFDAAETLFLELLEEKEPIDIAEYLLDTVNFYIKTKNIEKAKEYFKRLKKHKTELKINFQNIEIDILLAERKFKKAIDLLLDLTKSTNRSNVWFKLGKAYYERNAYKKAKEAFINAVELEQDSARFHNALAQTYYELEEYESCAEHAITSIEIVKFFPDAHYILGCALEKLGDLENAKIAYEMAAKMKPKEHARAEKLAENLEEKISEQLHFTNKSSFKYRKDQITIVSGLPRSGTSMMMQMLYKGGHHMLIDGKREADISNPKGYFEYKPVMSIDKDNSWLEKGKNKTIKIVAPLLRHLDPQFRYKIIFMKRDLYEIIASQQKMIGKNNDVFPIKIYNAFHKQLQFVEKWKEKEPGVELIYMDYKDVLENPEKAIDKIVEFIAIDLDKNAMVEAIDKSLYRNKAKKVSK